MGLTKDLHYTPPVRKTRRDKLNRFWPNVRYLGAGIVGLAEYSRQVDKGDACKIRIREALRNLTVRVTDSKVFLTVPKVHVYAFYSGEKYTSELYDHDEWDGSTANVGVRCILYTGNYEWRDVDVLPILDQYNQDYSYYSGLGLTIHRRPDKSYYANVFLYKIHYAWDDKSSYGYCIGHEFDVDLVGTARRGMRLKL